MGYVSFLVWQRLAAKRRWERHIAALNDRLRAEQAERQRRLRGV